MVDKELLLVLKSSGLGEEPDLGNKLMAGFLKTLYETGSIPARIICLSNGIFLTTVGTEHLEILKKFEQAGSEILSCSTCLEYYKRTDKLLIGQPTNMKATVTSMLASRKVLSP